MKKLLLAIISLFVISSSASAQCNGWRGLPGDGPAPKAYCWDIVHFKSLGGTEDIKDNYSTKYDHYGVIKWFDGNYYRGVLAKIDVYGIPQNRPDAKLKYRTGQLVHKQTITNEYDIVNGYRYWYYIPVSENDFYLSGTLEAKDYSDTKDTLYIK